MLLRRNIMLLLPYNERKSRPFRFTYYFSALTYFFDLNWQRIPHARGRFTQQNSAHLVVVDVVGTLFSHCWLTVEITIACQIRNEASLSIACLRSESKLRCDTLAFSVSEQLQIVYSDNSIKYNIEKVAKDEQLSTIEFVNSFSNSCCIF